ncbi:hypothetical protein KY328_03235 [Candidatus Woesearchaeota archaeon]|nr:hypothetical protein [Candidatus Woesearchaeota archaeon]MBW3021907.1 hypothetical protein [Candidatus Woesearchaeota archaeon]
MPDKIAVLTEKPTKMDHVFKGHDTVLELGIYVEGDRSDELIASQCEEGAAIDMRRFVDPRDVSDIMMQDLYHKFEGKWGYEFYQVQRVARFSPELSDRIRREFF